MLRFKFINQNWYLGTNYFFDAGMVTSLIDVDVTDLEDYLEGNADDYYIGGKDKLHMAAGLGLKVVMNENFIISADIGKALKEQDEQ